MGKLLLKDPFDAEIRSLLKRVEVCIELGISNLIIEGDRLMLVESHQ